MGGGAWDEDGAWVCDELKKGENVSARESYSSSPPLDDGKLPLLPESIFVFLEQKNEFFSRKQGRRRLGTFTTNSYITKTQVLEKREKVKNTNVFNAR